MSEMKIVVIDDDQGACVFLKKTIENAGQFSVVTTMDSKTAEELCANEKPDMIILDNVMPTLKGADLIKALRSKSRTKKIPIMMITGKGDMAFDQKKEGFEWKPNSPTVRTRGDVE